MKNIFKRFKTDILGIAFLAGALFVALALISYNPNDPSFNSFANFRKVSNWGGYVGSFLSDLLYQGFGITSWLAILGLGFAGFKSFQDEEVSIRSLKLAWGGVLMLVCMTLLGLYFPETKIFQNRIHLGGVLGLIMASIMVKIFNFVGASIILWAVTAMLAVFFSEKSVQEMFDALLLISRKIGQLFEFPIRKKRQPALAFAGPSPKPLIEKVPEIFQFNKKTKAEPPKVLIQEDIAEEVQEEDELPEEVAVEVKDRPRRKIVLKAKPPRRVENWEMPKLSMLLDPPASRTKVDKDELRRKAELLVEKLKMFNVTGEVMAVKPGPAVTMFEFKPSAAVRLNSITSMENDLAIALSAESLRIIAPIPGRDVVGIESSNNTRETVYLKDILAEDIFWKEDMKLPLCLGRQSNGDPKVVDLAKMPHLLVAGSTGSGKSVFTVSSILGLLFRHSPKTLRLILIDPKRVDLTTFSSIPHLLMPPIEEAHKAVAALRWAVKEMDKRYKSLSKFGARKLEDFNTTVSNFSSEQIAEHEKINEDLELANKKNQKYHFKPIPHIVIVVEEFGDLMQLDSSNVEGAVVRLAQLARAAGIHLVLCMQSPRKEIVTGLIKTNIPGRISFKVASKMDSRIILDEMGAERLLARGDMLFREPGTDKPMRHHGPWVTDEEIRSVAKFWSDQAEPEYDPIAMKALDAGETDEPGSGDYSGGDAADQDEMYDQIVEFVSSVKDVSASLLQRRFKLGYPRAARLIEILEKEGVVGPANGSKPRQVLINSYKD